MSYDRALDERSAYLEVVDPRTEVSVAADALIAVFESGLLKRNGYNYERVALAAGIPVEELNFAFARRRSGIYKPPAESPPSSKSQVNGWEDPESAERQKEYREKRWGEGHRHASERFLKKNPSPGMRICSACNETLPFAKFDVKDRKSGSLRSMCRECFVAYKKQRYVSVEDGRKIGALLQFITQQGDACVGHPCRKCKGLIAVGQEVEADNVLVAHAECAA